MTKPSRSKYKTIKVQCKSNPKAILNTKQSEMHKILSK